MKYSFLYELYINKDYNNLLLNLINFFHESPNKIFFYDYIRKVLKKKLILDINVKEKLNELNFYVNQKIKNRKKILFIDHSYHIKTQSSNFFIKILDEVFDIDVIWSNSWKGISDRHLLELPFFYDGYIYWQIFPDKKLIRKNTIIIPMWDSVYDKDKDFWLDYKSCKFIAFSEVLHKKLISLSISSVLYKYIPNISEEAYFYRGFLYKKPIVFYWARTTSVNWNIVKTLLKADQVEKILFCTDSDPYNNIEYPSTLDISQYNIEFVKWTPNKLNHLERLKNVDIFIAPRLLEGIGFSFINAIENGCVIIANNAPTMNEYINHQTGFLFDVCSVFPIDISIWHKKKLALFRYYKNIQREDLFGEKVLSLFD